MRTITYLIDRYFGVVAILAIFTLSVGVYSPALNSGFFLDDASSIRTEPLMLQAEIWPLLEKFGLRFVGYLSFWSNYQLSGEDPTAFRATNIFIHALNGLFVYILSRQLLSLSDGIRADPARVVTTDNFASTYCATKVVALGVALLFVVHPLQTQAVTYIVQRLASLMTLFYLGALLAWLQAAVSETLLARLFWLAVFVASALLAFFTKQNAFTLPFVLVLIEILILRRVSRQTGLMFFLVFVVSSAAIALFDADLIIAVDRLTRETTAISRWEYFQHQWVILWLYMGKVVWPYPQVLDYGIALGAYSKMQIFTAGFAHALAIVMAVVFRRKYPLVAFGVLFFYLTHSVESGLIPIRDLAFEHRNYLPLYGVVLAVAALFRRGISSSSTYAKFLASISLCCLVFFGQATVARNHAWADQEALLMQDIAYNANNTRARYNLAVWLQRNGRSAESIDVLREMFDAEGAVIDELHLTLFITLLIDAGRYMEAFEFAQQISTLNIPPKLRGDYLRLIATTLTGMGIDVLAVDMFEISMRFAPLTYEGGVAYGYSLLQLRRFARAENLITHLETRFGDRPRLRALREALPTP